MQIRLLLKALVCMQKITITLIIIVGLATVFPCAGQTPNISKLYKKALKEKNTILRLNKLNEIIVLEPTHAKALYEIGLIYKQQHNYRDAQNYFSLARNSFDENLKDDKKVEVLYDLANAYEKNGKYQLYEKILNEIQSLPITPAFRSQLDFELGRLYYKQSRYEKAMAILTQSKGLVEKDTKSYLNLIEIIKTTQGLEQKYAQAEQERSNGNFQVAYDLFAEINEIVPGFKNVETKLKSLHAAIKRADEENPEQKKIGTALSSNADSLIQREFAPRVDFRKLADKTAVLPTNKLETDVQLEVFDSTPDDTTRPLEELPQASFDEINSINSDILTQSFRIDIDSLYTRALTAFNEKNWLDATIDFEVLQNLHRDYKGSD